MKAEAVSKLTLNSRPLAHFTLKCISQYIHGKIMAEQVILASDHRLASVTNCKQSQHEIIFSCL